MTRGADPNLRNGRRERIAFDIDVFDKVDQHIVAATIDVPFSVR